MKLSIFIWTASLLGLAHSEEEFGEFEDKVSILIKKLMDSKYLMSENESTLLKVSKFQNEFMKSSFLSKYEPNIVRISALTVPHYRAEIFTIFGSYFGRNDDFINSF
jgi:hypothetical protein